MRNISPEIIVDPWFSSMSLLDRQAWMALLLTCDDQGRFVSTPALVRSTCFPADDISLAEVELILQRMFEGGKVHLYTIGNVRYGQIVNWWKFQGNSEWMAPSKHPAPEGWSDCWRINGKGNKTNISANWSDRSGGWASSKVGTEVPTEVPTQVPTVEGTRYINVNDNDNDNDNVNDGYAEKFADARQFQIPPVSQFNLNSGLLAARELLQSVTGFVYVPNTKEWTEASGEVSAMMTAFGRDPTATALGIAWDKWRKTPRKPENGGGTYSKLNPGFVRWAYAHLNGEAPWEKDSGQPDFKRALAEAGYST